MSLIKQAATFRGTVLEHACNETSTGLPQFEVRVQGIELFDDDVKEWVDWSGEEENELTAYLVLFTHDNNPIFHAQSVMKVFDWDGMDFEYLANGDFVGTQIQFRVIENDPEYVARRPFVVASIDVFDAEPSRTMKNLDEDKVKQMNAKFAAGLRKLSGGPKPKSVPKTPPKAADKPKTTTKPPKKTTPPKKKETSLNAEQVWELCCERKPEDVTDKQLEDAWVKVTDEFGADEKITADDKWGEVCHQILKAIGAKDDIPF